MGPRRNVLRRQKRVWGYPVVPGLFIVVATWILVQTFVSAPLDSSIGVAVVGVGILFYFYRSATGAASAPANPAYAYKRK
jgi:hypothetical protein